MPTAYFAGHLKERGVSSLQALQRLFATVSRDGVVFNTRYKSKG